jgi:hypothetical protein
LRPKYQRKVFIPDTLSLKSCNKMTCDLVRGGILLHLI